eukprot:3052349-Rhodomonas_salina.1
MSVGSDPEERMHTNGLGKFRLLTCAHLTRGACFRGSEASFPRSAGPSHLENQTQNLSDVTCDNDDDDDDDDDHDDNDADDNHSSLHERFKW